MFVIIYLYCYFYLNTCIIYTKKYLKLCKYIIYELYKFIEIFYANDLLKLINTKRSSEIIYNLAIKEEILNFDLVFKNTCIDNKFILKYLHFSFLHQVLLENKLT